MTAPATGRTRNRCASGGPVFSAFTLASSAAALFCFASPASGQVGAAVSLASQSVYRGYSLSNGRPTASLDLSYDSPSGFYAAARGSLVDARGSGIHPLGLQLNLGYVKPLSTGTSVDAGITRSSYTRYSGFYGRRSYAEIYAGVTTRLLSSHLYYSPHALGSGRGTLYAEANASSGGYSGFSLDAHAGVLLPLKEGDDKRSRLDWQLGVSRPVGRLSLRAAINGGGPGREYYGAYYHYPRAHRFTVGVTCAL